MVHAEGSIRGARACVCMFTVYQRGNKLACLSKQVAMQQMSCIGTHYI